MIRTRLDSRPYSISAGLVVGVMVLLIVLSVPASACNYGSIGDFVWEDLNANGIQDPGEPGISDVTVKLYDSRGNKIGVTKTDTNGFYKFAKVIPGKKYCVKFLKPSGWVFSPRDQGSNNAVDSDPDMSTGKTALTYISSGENDCRWDAGMYKKAGVSDFVWEDTNRNGIQDAGEPGIAGVEVRLYSGAGVLQGSTSTDINGFYQFTCLMPGEYYLKFVLPTGYDGFTPQETGTDSSEDSNAASDGQTSGFTLQSGEYDLTWDAGVYKTSNQEIPEFPTIALPMIAVIGLALVFRRKDE